MTLVQWTPGGKPAILPSMTLAEVLEDLSDAVNYRRWLSALVQPYLGDNPLEIGSGLGNYAQEWLPHLPRLTVSEADDDRLVRSKAAFAESEKVQVRHIHLPAVESADYSAVIALNVLEHIQEDVAALASAATLVKPGGFIVLVVPAFESAMSAFDRRVGHFRRYTMRSLAAALSGAGLQIEELRYINPIGLIAWYVLCRGMGKFPSNGLPLRAYDRLLVPILRLAERRMRPPFGQSVFAVARSG
jgi:SAM-dependent methyltransferase